MSISLQEGVCTRQWCHTSFPLHTGFFNFILLFETHVPMIIAGNFTCSKRDFATTLLWISFTLSIQVATSVFQCFCPIKVFVSLSINQDQFSRPIYYQVYLYHHQENAIVIFIIFLFLLNVLGEPGLIKLYNF